MINPFSRTSPTELFTSKLHDQDSFYPAFMRDLSKCKHGVIIESPFLTRRRLSLLMPVLEKLKSRRVKIIVNTRDPLTCDVEYMRGRRLVLSRSTSTIHRQSSPEARHTRPANTLGGQLEHPVAKR